MALRRVSTWITDKAWEEFMALAEQDGLTMSDRLRGLIDIWQHDPEFRRRADAHAREMAIEHRRRRYNQHP